MNILDKADAVGTLRLYLQSKGLRLEVLTNYEQISDLVRRAGKEYLTPLSSPSHNDFTSENCIWLCAWNGDEPAILGAARLEDLGAESIASYWNRSLGRAYPVEAGNRISDVDPVISRRVGGRLVYFGDLFVRTRARGHRADLRAFTALGHLLVSLKWEPNWTYCYLRNADMSRGAAFNYGFNWLRPKPFVWVGEPPHPRSNQESAAFLHGDDLPAIIGQVLDDIIGSHPPQIR